ASLPRAQASAVTADYFRALGAPLVRGRFFTEGDDLDSPRVVLIDETLARRYWPKSDPIGHRLKFGGRNLNRPWVTIAGIVGNIKTDGFDQPDQPHIYLSYLQSPGYTMAIYLRSEVNPAGLAQSVRQQVQAVDPDLPVFGEQTMEELIAASMGQ